METTTEQQQGQQAAERDEFDEYMAGVRSGAIDEASTDKAKKKPPQSLEPEIEAFLSAGLMLSGRRFVRPAALTFQRREYMAVAFDGTQILSFIGAFDSATDDVDILTMAISAHLYERGKLFIVIAGLLVADGTPWTPAVAQANAPFFAELSDPADLAAIDDALLWLVLDFFLRSRGSNGTFLRYLTRHGLAVRASAIASETARDLGRNQDVGGEASTSATTTPSSETLPAGDGASR